MTSAQVIAESFDFLDASHDGILTGEDGMTSMNEMLRRFGRDPDSPQAHKYRESVRQLWGSMLAAADEDNDGKITRDEYIAYHESLPSADLDKSIELYADAVFALADSDDNSQLKKEEFILSHRYLSPQTADDLFRRYDKDGDGALSKAEYLECMRHLMT